MSNSTASKTEITLKGSVEIVSEFFFTAINSILYQRGTRVTFCFCFFLIAFVCDTKTLSRARSSHNDGFDSCYSFYFSIPPGIYQPESFRRDSKYGLTVLTTTDEGLLSYLDKVMAQVGRWLLRGDVQRLVLVVSGVDSGDTLERWQFNVSLDDNDGENQLPNSSSAAQQQKTLKEIHGEIQAIVRQITASVTFLPLLNEPCSFDLLVYTNKDAQVPAKWEDSDPCYIMNSQEVKLRSFTTSVR
jgi:mitotic spindle assembly checkpoint protein MAD2